MKSFRLKHVLFSTFFILVASSSHSQSLHIKGKIINEQKEALSRASVTLRHIGGGRVVAFTQTSENGNFELKKDPNTIQPDSLEIYFSHVGYAPQTQKLPVDEQPLLVEMASATTELREVSVSSQPIWQQRDTVAYLVSSFSSIEDRTIGDVLKKMPGVEVLETGHIRYQGKDINKFYVEGSDLLGGRYGLATNNISHKDVATVEVMENHQPIRALEDVVFSDSPAMNIKLKEDAKTRWAGTVKGGGGLPELWIAEAFAMRFKLKTQTLNTCKGNNTGNESFELSMFTPTSDFASSLPAAQLPSYIRVSQSTASGIGSSRSTFNQTKSLTSNNLMKVGKDFDLVAEFAGSLDRRESEQVTKTTYFLGDEQISIEDMAENVTGIKKSLTGKIRLKSNQSTYYINNNLNFDYDRNDPSVIISGSFPNRQTAGIENLKIGNDFDILRRRGEKFFTIRSSNEYLSKPQSLEVIKNELPSIRSTVALSSFTSQNTTSYSFMFGKFRIQSPITLSYQYRQIENTQGDTTNCLNTQKLKFDITPSTTYRINDFQLSLSGFLYYQALWFENATHHLYGLNPRFSMNWSVSPLLSMRTSLSLSDNLPDENLYYHGRITHNYRSATSGYIDFTKGKTTNYSANMAYKDIVMALFADIGVQYLKRRFANISGQDFFDDYIVNHYYPGKRTASMTTVFGSLSKGVGLIKGVVAIYPSYSRSKSSMERNGTTIPFSSETWSLRGNVSSRIGNKCNLTYNASYGFSKHQMDVSNRQYFSSTRLSESLKITYAPLKILQLNHVFDHYCNELTQNNFKHFFFSDFSVSYLPGSRWEFAFSAKNIFDERYYSYFIESELTTFYRSYTIRPRNILASATFRF